MFSKQLTEWIETGFESAMKKLSVFADGKYAEEVQVCMNTCSEDEQTVMKYYYSAMPYSDIADTDFNLLKLYAQHAVFLRREIPWCREIPEKTFLMDVAAYRINNEKIMDCRSLFFREVWNRVKGLSMKEAVIEINYWCAEHASYHLADPRTASALTVYRSGFGRCGEESVFAVTVLRSLGIPARQVYTPLWAHCDDNHAWVEVWCDGDWYFLGACEPEEVLNKGWFTGPASRAMLLHTKYFTCLPLEEAEFTEGFVHYVNRISMYAHSTQLTVEVVDDTKRPLAGVMVYFELLNAARYGGIASKMTDQNGCVTIELGRGDVRLHLVKDGIWMERDINTLEGTVQIVFEQAKQEPEEVWKEYCMHAPDFAVLHPGIQTMEQRKRNRKRAAAADKMRLERIASWYDEKRAAAYPSVQERLKASAANFDELMRFLEKDDNPYRAKLLLELPIKDMYDLSADVLEEHLEAAMPYEGKFSENDFVKYLLSPRVEHEELSCWRKFLKEAFTEEETAAFNENPKLIWKYIQENISYNENMDYERLRITPKSAMTLRMADPASKRILFCAICRSLGIPARLGRRYWEPQYYKDGKFIAASEEKEVKRDAIVDLEFEEGTEWNYFRNWTCCVLKNGMFRPLGLHHKPVQNFKQRIEMEAGTYRLIATVRIPNGNQLIRELTFSVGHGEHRTIQVTKCHVDEKALLTDREISVPSVVEYAASSNDQKQAIITNTESQKKEIPIAAGTRQMVLWLDPGKEPTQHVLNELLDNRELCGKLSDRIVLFVQSTEAVKEPVFAKVMTELPSLTWYLPTDWQLSERIAQELNLQAYQYPLVYVRDSRKHVIYGDCGYNVGSVDLMLKLLQGQE